MPDADGFASVELDEFALEEDADEPGTGPEVEAEFIDASSL